MKDFTEIGTVCGRPLVLTTATEYNKLPKSKTRLNIVYTFIFHGNQLALYHDKVCGFIERNELHFFANGYSPYWSNYMTEADYIPVTFDKVVAIENCGDSNPNAQPTPRSNDRKDKASIHNDSHEARPSIPASLYSSWIHPEVENSLCDDYWLSNIDRLICETLADSATIVDKYLRNK